MNLSARATELRTPASKAPAAWLRRVGRLGFWFFLAKGLCWLAVPSVLAWVGSGF